MLFRSVIVMALGGAAWWLYKLDDRTHDNAKTNAALMAEIQEHEEDLDEVAGTMRREFESLRDTINDGNDQTRELQREAMASIGQRLMAFEIKLTRATAALEGFERRFEVDDEARAEMRNRILELERQPRRPQLLGVPESGSY